MIRPAKLSRQAASRYFPFASLRMLNAAKRESGRAVLEAIHEGRLVRQPCSVCGRKKAEAHHEDYGKPFEIVWLCRKHHTHRHFDLRYGGAGPITIVAFPPPPIRRRYFVRLNGQVSCAAVQQATEAVIDALNLADLPDSELARRVGTSRQAVSQNLSGGIRTVKMLAAFADALNCDLHFSLVPRPSSVRSQEAA